MPATIISAAKQPAHPVIKRPAGQIDIHHEVPGLIDAHRFLPVAPLGPPPSFGTREEWINSLPSWRRAKPRRIWEDDHRAAAAIGQQGFLQGLASAGNAAAIKGNNAQACIPPLYTLIKDSYHSAAPQTPEDDEEEMSPDSYVDHSPYDIESQWSASPIEGDSHGNPSPVYDVNTGSYERGAFSPVFEDDVPGMDDCQDMDSSPAEPVTPFGDFIDRVVAAGQDYAPEYGAHSDGPISQAPAPVLFDPPFESRYVAMEYTVDQQVIPEPEHTVSLTNASYRRMAEPMADWIATYIWRVCTTGMSLPQSYSRSLTHLNQYSLSPPANLAGAVHSLLLSTLLQPSAIVLALWYVVRLPVYLGAAGSTGELERAFRDELFGVSYHGSEIEAVGAKVPFRLVLLGFMLANKWLDDHTFSNKTWHTISGIPILSINKLEEAALKLLQFDLSVPPRQWAQWLAHVSSYHQSLMSPGRCQPISRPSSNPHSIVRLVFEEIVKTTDAGFTAAKPPQPVFMGLEERKAEPVIGNQPFEPAGIDFDDEDGPLRAEYLPKRRIDGTDVAYVRGVCSFPSQPSINMGKSLPPPAKWSPEADERLFPFRNPAVGQYIPVQAPFVPIGVPPFHQPISDVAAPFIWARTDSDQFGSGFNMGQVRDSYGLPGAINGGHVRRQSFIVDHHPNPRQHAHSVSNVDYKSMGDCGSLLACPQERGRGLTSTEPHYGYMPPYGCPLVPRLNAYPWLRS